MNPVPFILALMGVVLVCAAIAPVMYFTAQKGSHQQCYARFVGGTAYILLGVLGLLTFGSLHGNTAYFTVPFSIAIIGLGVAMFHFGAKALKKLNGSTKK
jgi:uncharacterized membrane protein HdeD (DUF308 family)